MLLLQSTIIWYQKVIHRWNHVWEYSKWNQQQHQSQQLWWWIHNQPIQPLRCPWFSMRRRVEYCCCCCIIIHGCRIVPCCLFFGVRRRIDDVYISTKNNNIWWNQNATTTMKTRNGKTHHQVLVFPVFRLQFCFVLDTIRVVVRSPGHRIRKCHICTSSVLNLSRPKRRERILIVFPKRRICLYFDCVIGVIDNCGPSNRIYTIYCVFVWSLR